MAHFDSEVTPQDRMAMAIQQLSNDMQQNNLITQQIARDQVQQNQTIQQIAHDQIQQNNYTQQTANGLNFLREKIDQGQQRPPLHVPPPQPLPHQPPPPNSPPPPPPLDLNLPTPAPYSGTPSDLRSFQLRLCEFLSGSPARYRDDFSKILYSAAILTGPARKWYEGLLDPATHHLPPSYTFEGFLLEMADFFGGSVNIINLERDLRNLRQTGSVSEFAITFQNITNCFHPRWADHPLIFEFSGKLKEGIRYELTGRGALPLTFQAYVAAAVLVELNLANQQSSRGSSQPPAALRQPFTPKTTAPANQPRLQQSQPPNHDPNRMDIDGTGRARGPLSQEERMRRFDAGLCAYCGKPGHVSASCPNRGGYQARGTFQIPNGF